jgi:hypothetical protein
MPLRTVYCVQGYTRKGQALRPKPLYQCGCRDAALAEAEIMRQRVAGVLVYSVEGSSSLDSWSMPRVIAAYGETPRLRLA